MIKAIVILCIFLMPFMSAAQQSSVVYQVRFERNKSQLSEQAKQILSHVYDTLRGKKDYLIYVNGHTDSDADRSYNQQLSFKRSLAVKDFLVEKGMNEALFRVQALGEDQPIVANTVPVEKAKNRRVELLVLFEQEIREEVIEPKEEPNIPGCNGDTTITLANGYKIVMSNCDWQTNSECLRIEKKLRYRFETKESWLKKHIGFKNYKKVIRYEPHYQFYVVSCTDSCFQKPIKLFIPQYQAPELKTGVRYSQRKNNKAGSAGLVFKKIRQQDSAYYVADIYCPGILNCGTDNRCNHPIDLYAKNNISIISYSYFIRSRSGNFDSLVEARPLSSERLSDNYRHAFFHTLDILYKGDTIRLENIPIDAFPHGRRKIKTLGNKDDKAYFLFIPYRRKYACGHYKKYKIKAKDIGYLKQFNLFDLEAID